MNQNNRLQPGGPGKDTYDLTRWRHYLDLKAGENFRFYVEGIDAGCFGEDLPIQGIDENRWDLQNFFMDVDVFETGTGTHTVRVGRQELLFGRQRLVSSLNWANTRRDFEGLNYIVKERDYKLNIFCVNPVNSATGCGDEGRSRCHEPTTPPEWPGYRTRRQRRAAVVSDMVFPAAFAKATTTRQTHQRNPAGGHS